MEKEYEYTGKFSIMIRNESIGIANVMKALQNAPEKFDWKDLMAKNAEERM